MYHNVQQMLPVTISKKYTINKSNINKYKIVILE